MKITTKGLYALTCLIAMAKDIDKVHRLEDLANAEGITLNYLQQIFKNLKNNKVIKSIRGPNGGYKLLLEPSAIIVNDVLNCVGDETKLIAKFSKSDNSNKVVSFFNKQKSNYINSVRNTTLQDLLEM
jgi:Rrf2 family protein